jgi:hypothetical protein
MTWFSLSGILHVAPVHVTVAQKVQQIGPLCACAQRALYCVLPQIYVSMFKVNCIKVPHHVIHHTRTKFAYSNFPNKAHYGANHLSQATTIHCSLQQFIFFQRPAKSDR